ncbi:hypothetical protein CEXT_636231 [Caerostris extrusa]|uniref:FF domain-containing protein n=1 Tax=Caerostris extrusa TaxID=172846 RepID=A0AAV4TQI3_CAEEX|nr:hypothetical protein CEXT_636231 [Caerostris extrusa]
MYCFLQGSVNKSLNIIFVKTRRRKSFKTERNSKKLKEEYKSLLREANVNINIRFTDFAHQHGKDPRFKAVEKLKDREVLFNEFVDSLHNDSKKNLSEEQKTAF